MVPSLRRAIPFRIRSSLCWANPPSRARPKASAPLFKSAISVSSKRFGNSRINAKSGGVLCRRSLSTSEPPAFPSHFLEENGNGRLSSLTGSRVLLGQAQCVVQPWGNLTGRPCFSGLRNNGHGGDDDRRIADI